MPRKKEQEPVTCSKCGGSGVEPSIYGPFYSAIPQRLHRKLDDHIKIRHAIFKEIDQTIALEWRELIEMQTYDEMVNDLPAVLAEAATAWTTDRESALQLLRAAAIRCVWLLEVENAD